MDLTKNFHFMLMIPGKDLCKRDHNTVLRVFKKEMGIKSHEMNKTLFVFTLREENVQDARAKVLEAMRKAGNAVGRSTLRYVMTVGTCLVHDDIVVCDPHKYAEENGWYRGCKDEEPQQLG